MSGRFSATDGMLYDGKLYAVDQSRDLDREYRSPTVLAIDPASERVMARYWLPGRPVAFSVDGEDLVIRYDGGLDGAPQIERNLGFPRIAAHDSRARESTDGSAGAYVCSGCGESSRRTRQTRP